eukprot:SAG11_NODE_1506_length_4781_cov_2.355831_5_plen_43_part_00
MAISLTLQTLVRPAIEGVHVARNNHYGFYTALSSRHVCESCV